MIPLQVVGIQQSLSGPRSSLILKSMGTDLRYSLTLWPHQVRLLELASCRCTQAPTAHEAIASALGGRFVSVLLTLRDQAGPAADLVITPDDGLTTLRAPVDTVEALALAIRLDVPMFLAEAPQSGRASSQQEGASEAKIAPPIRKFLDSLDTTGI